MNTAELKIDIINKISNLNEIRIIEDIQKLLDFELTNDVFQLSEDQHKRIKEAQQDNLISNEQANKEIEVWLKGK
jgi:hypothetical protein